MSKEEIEKAKERLSKKLENEKVLGMLAHIDKIVDENILDNIAIETLLQYIDQLETSNAELDKENNRLEKIEFERDKANKIIDEMAEHIVSSAVVDDTVCSRIFCEVQEDCSHKKMLSCTKQYFEKKVGGNK